jgi:hypothetical protein
VEAYRVSPNLHPGFAALALCLGLAGCAAMPPSPAPADKAVVAGKVPEGTTFLGFAIRPAAMHTDVWLSRVDGQRVEPDARPRDYWIEPGRRALVARCAVSVQGQRYEGEGELIVDLYAGQRYRLHAEAVPGAAHGTVGRCAPSVAAVR